MKKLLLLLILSLLAMSQASATLNAALKWEGDPISSSKTITQGDNINFQFDIAGKADYVDVYLVLKDSNGNVKHKYFDDRVMPLYGEIISMSETYTISPEHYETLGEFIIDYKARAVWDDNEESVPLGSLSLFVVPPSTELTVTASANPTNGEAPLDVDFGCSATGGYPEYIYGWTFGDGYYEQTQMANHVYNNAGTYTATCYVVDQYGNEGSDSVTIIVDEAIIPNEAPIADFQISPNPSLIGEELTLDGSLSYDPDGDSLTYEWDIGNDGDIEFTGLIAYKTFYQAKNYPIKLTVSDGEHESSVVKIAEVQEYYKDFSINMDVNPDEGLAPLTVEGFCSYETFGEGLEGTYTPVVNFGDGTLAYNQSTVTHTYNNPGIYAFNCGIVQEETGITKTKTMNVRVLEPHTPELEITKLNCFDQIIAGHEQACEVFVEEDGEVSPNAAVKLFKTSGELLGSCTTNSISGGCNVQYIENIPGTFTVYATAMKKGFVSDDDTYPRFTYDVLEETFDIKNLKVYEDSAYSIEEDTFYRGEDMYVTFEVYDAFGNNIDPSEIKITKATLISTPGGRIELTKDFEQGTKFYYELSQIPLTHDFFGDSQVFTFAFDFQHGGGQETADLTILNNPPRSRNIPDQTMIVGESISLDLNNYFLDLENDVLQYEVSYSNSAISAEIQNRNNLEISALEIGTSTVTVTAEDYDGDYTSESFNVLVNERNYEDFKLISFAKPVSGEAPLLVFTWCYEFAVPFTGEDANYDIRVDFGDGTVNNGRYFQTHTYDNPGVYTYSCSITQEETGIVKEHTETITVTEASEENQAPVAILTGPEAVIVGETKLYDASSSYDPEGGALVYFWYVNGQRVSYGSKNALNYQFASKGSYNIRVEVYDLEGLKDVAEVNVIASEKVVPKPEEPEKEDHEFTFRGIGIMGHDVNRVRAGETLYVTVGTDSDETEGRPSLIIPELGLKATGQLNDLEGRESMTLKLWIPPSTPPGDYMLRVGFKSEEVRKGEIRWITVE